jgi:UDP-2,3-diacylglucosamine hydrolase
LLCAKKRGFTIKAYFFSDAHLGIDDSSFEHERQKKLLEFLDFIAKDASHIYIVGDLFDFWFEYRLYIPKIYFSFLYKFKSLVKKGIEMHYLAGNHDFYLGQFFDKEIGIKTWPDEYEFSLNGKYFYLWHGDGLGKKDGGYRLLKKIMRSRINQKLFSWIHPDFGFSIARFLSGSSRKYTNQLNHLRDESDYFRFAEERFKEGADYVLMGHRHNPLEHIVGEKKYINLGDWIKYFSYAVFDGNKLDLRYFNKEKVSEK